MIPTGELPKFRAAAIQDAPVFLDPKATAEKAAGLIEKARDGGAHLVVFPEVFLPGYPYWNWITDPVTGSEWFERLAKASILLPGPEIQIVCEAAARARAYVVIGANERDPVTLGSIYNTLVIIGPDGSIIGKHRKLVPTWAEKLTWAGGDGTSLRVYETGLGPLGVLACGENTNTLARFALLAQGELVHAASYISLPVAPPDYDMAEAIRLRAAAHSFEGKLFSVVSTSTISEEIVEEMQKIRPDADKLLRRKSSAWSGVIGPDGRTVGQPLIDEVGLVFADIDLNRCIQPKQMHDIVGHYNRFDIFRLTVNNEPQSPLLWKDPVEDHRPVHNNEEPPSGRDRRKQGL